MYFTTNNTVDENYLLLAQFFTCAYNIHVVHLVIGLSSNGSFVIPAVEGLPFDINSTHDS